MKKIVILAALAAAGAASAQSSVTLFGVVDAAVRQGEERRHSLSWPAAASTAAASACAASRISATARLPASGWSTA